jgi:hypothetical protein
MYACATCTKSDDSTTARQAVTVQQLTLSLHSVAPFSFTVNYKNKDILYIIGNIAVKHLNFSCSNAMKLVRRI